MERTVAFKKLGRLLGKNMGYRVDDKAPTKEEREAARTELQLRSSERKSLSEQLEARREEILKQDPEYQRLKEAYGIARDRAEKLRGISGRYKITVGVSNGMFFTVEAEGDSWEEIIATIEKKKVR